MGSSRVDINNSRLRKGTMKITYQLRFTLTLSPVHSYTYTNYFRRKTRLLLVTRTALFHTALLAVWRGADRRGGVIRPPLLYFSHTFTQACCCGDLPTASLCSTQSAVPHDFFGQIQKNVRSGGVHYLVWESSVMEATKLSAVPA